MKLHCVRFILLVTVFCLVLSGAMFGTANAQAATFEEINETSMFFKQAATGTTSYQCTLFAAASMVRRAARLNGDPNYANITPGNMESTAWVSAGLRNSFTYQGISVATGSLPKTSENVNILINLLNNHPEGIVLYGYTNQGGTHAVLLTDYTDGVFYCADSGNLNLAVGRYTYDYNYSKATSIAMQMVNCGGYWYVTTPVSKPTSPDTVNPVMNGGQLVSFTATGYDMNISASDNKALSHIYLGTWNDAIGIDSAVWKDIPVSGTSASVSAHIDISEVGGAQNTTYHTNAYAMDAYGNVSEVKRIADVFIDGEPPVISSAYVTNITGEGYDIVVNYSDNAGVTKVQYPTWTEPGGQDDIAAEWWVNPGCSGTLNNGVSTYHVSIGDHGNQTGCTYNTHVYAYDAAGNYTTYGLTAYVPFVPSESWIETSSLPAEVNSTDYEIQYYHTYTTVSPNSPGSGWYQTGLNRQEYQASGDAYWSDVELTTSNERRLVSYYYYHYCGASTGNNAEHYQTGNYVHYDSITDPSLVTVVSEHTDDTMPQYKYYVLKWASNGAYAYCKSGTTCTGANGTHGQRSYYWYKVSRYQNYTLVNYYNWRIDSGWVSERDYSASSVLFRYRRKTIDISAIELGSRRMDVSLSDGSIALSPQVYPANAYPGVLTWYCDDEETATVADGVVTLLHPGAVLITCGDANNAEMTANMLLVIHDDSSLVIPPEVKVIEKDAFSGNAAITEVYLPAGLERIEEGAFENCVNLRLLIAPSVHMEIEYGAFTGCNALTALVPPGSVMMDYLMTDCNGIRRCVEFTQ